MKLIVDEIPKYAKDCLFIERRYGDPDAFLKCKINNSPCDLYFEKECPCLRQQNDVVLNIDYAMPDGLKIKLDKHNTTSFDYKAVELSEMSTFDLDAEVRYINDQLDCDDRVNPLSWARVQELQEYKKKLIEEINHRDNERFR